VSGTRRLVQTLELVVSGDTIEGLIRPENGPNREFSGWSELFAQLQSSTSELGHDHDTDDAATTTDRSSGQAGEDHQRRG
jgi:hypothetical protein